MIIAKKHITADRRLILALCDKEIIGKKFSTKNAQLDLACSFYKGEPADEQECKKLISSSSIINAVGKESTGLLKKMGLVEKVADIAGVPHAQVVIEQS